MLETFLKNSRQQTLAKYTTRITQINKLGIIFKKSTDAELRRKTIELREQLVRDENVDNIINTAFALVREASDRVLGLRHYDVQLIGGLVLHEGNIAEMKTGEGKTLVALLPTFFNALYNKGTHVVTVNDYLARRDAESVGQVHRFLGLTVGLIQDNMTSLERRENYACDVVYVTNNELGFDYLRDNMAYNADEMVQRPFFYCVIDEVDSILIDEARTPLIISGTNKAPVDKYLQTAKIAAGLTRNVHYLVDEKTQNATLIEAGTLFCEQTLGLVDLYSPQEPWISYILNSIKAKELFLINKNYIINSNNEVVIVDEFTGRTMVGRRWSDGLHQAIEAKENVPIQDESQTLASITYQNLFKLYENLSGMTGTAKTEEAEFDKIYETEVIQIPTHLPIKRKDFPDLIYKNQYVKWRAVAQECLEMYQIGRPVLIGTGTIENSELLAVLLNEYGVPHQLLNARPENVEREAEIVAQAGCRTSITIATNMAGRGTDIVLGGNPTFLTKAIFNNYFEKQVRSSDLDTSLQLYSERVKDNLEKAYNKLKTTPLAELETSQDETAKIYLEIYKTSLKQNKATAKIECNAIRDLGGLHVIGTERHESRRIDNQLRGRAGRQGDPGSSRFFLSLEDQLLRLFGGDKIVELMQNVGFQDNTPIQSQLLNKSLESAQKKVEAYYFDTRKQLFDYDQPLNRQRDGVYAERKSILEQTNLRNWVVDYAERSLCDLVMFITKRNELEKLNSSLVRFQTLVGSPFSLTFFDSIEEPAEYLSVLQQQIQVSYDLKELEMESIETGLLRELEKAFILQQIDFAWKEHLQKILLLRDSIRWRAYGQKDPLTEYKKEAFNYFTLMLARIRHRVVYFLLRSKVIID